MMKMHGISCGLLAFYAAGLVVSLAIDLGFVRFVTTIGTSDSTNTTSIHQTGPDMSNTSITVRNKRTASDSTRPVSTIYDRTIEDQIWYLGRGGMNVFEAWEQCVTGKGISVAVVDDGVHKYHPELQAAYDGVNSFDASTGRVPGYTYARSLRGTMTAGVIANSPTQGRCGVGVAYGAKIIDIRLPFGEELGDDVEARAFRHAVEQTDIYSNSWEPSEKNQLHCIAGPRTLAAVTEGINKGRRGKGAIYVWAAGNGGINGNSCAYDGYVNCRYTIPVAGVTRSGRKLRSGERCSAIMTATYSQHSSDDDIITSDGTRSCERHFSDSSLATPFASGIIALVLQANPNLSWRDVQHIIAETGDYVPNVSGWKRNAAGYHVNSAIGFGLMNAGKMVRLAKVWSPVVPPATSCLIESPRGSWRIPYQGEVSIPVRVPEQCRIDRLEHVEVVVDLTFTRRGHVKASLSHGRMESVLLPGRLQDVYNTKLDNWRVVSVHFWGEDPRTDEWTLKLANTYRQYRGSGVLRSWKVMMYGTAGWTPTELPSRTNRECTVNYNGRPISDADSTPARPLFPSIHTTPKTPFRDNTDARPSFHRRHIRQVSQSRDCSNNYNYVGYSKQMVMEPGQYTIVTGGWSYCKDRCNTDPSCRSFIYYGDRRCSLNKIMSTDTTVEDLWPRWSVHIYDRICSLITDVCASNPCQNRASCVPTGNDYTCQCVIGYQGDHCQTNVCASNPCQNGASCVPTGNDYTCQCVIGYQGDHCQTSLCAVTAQFAPQRRDIELHLPTNQYREYRVAAYETCQDLCRRSPGCMNAAYEDCQDRCRSDPNCRSITFYGLARCVLNYKRSNETDSVATVPSGSHSYFADKLCSGTSTVQPTSLSSTTLLNCSNTYTHAGYSKTMVLEPGQYTNVTGGLLVCKDKCNTDPSCRSYVIYYREGRCSLNKIMSTDTTLEDISPTQPVDIYDRNCDRRTVVRQRPTMAPAPGTGTSNTATAVRQRPTMAPAPGTGTSNTATGCTDQFVLVATDKELRLQDDQYTTRMDISSRSACHRECARDSECRSYTSNADGNGHTICILNKINSTQTTLQSVHQYASYVYDRVCTALCPVTTQFETFQSDIELDLPANQYREYPQTTYEDCKYRCIEDRNCRSITFYAQRCVLNYKRSTETTATRVPSGSHSYFADRSCSGIDV